MTTFTKIAVVDVESTCWESPEEQAGQSSEIIELGICLLALKTGEIELADSILLTPKQSAISPFCSALTGITSVGMAKHGRPYEELKEFCRPYRRFPWASWGEYDRRMIDQHVWKGDFPYPFGHGHLNIKLLASLTRQATSGMNLAAGVQAFGLSFAGHPHHAMSDAYNAACVLRKLLC